MHAHLESLFYNEEWVYPTLILKYYYCLSQACHSGMFLKVFLQHKLPLLPDSGAFPTPTQGPARCDIGAGAAEERAKARAVKPDHKPFPSSAVRVSFSSISYPQFPFHWEALETSPSFSSSTEKGSYCGTAVFFLHMHLRRGGEQSETKGIPSLCVTGILKQTLKCWGAGTITTSNRLTVPTSPLLMSEKNKPKTKKQPPHTQPMSLEQKNLYTMAPSSSTHLSCLFTNMLALVTKILLC